jgi:hypothetical protein
MGVTQAAYRVLVGACGLLVAQSLPRCALAQNAAGGRANAAPAAVEGVIVDSTGAPIFYAVVTVVGEPGRATTDSEGRFHLSPVSPGPQLLAVRALGYEPAAVALSPKPGETLREKFTLSKRGVTLSALTVVAKPEPPARLAGFYRRRDLGLGKFLTREDIDRKPTNDVQELFLGMPGVQVQNVNGTSWVVFPRCGRFAVYLDGELLHGDPNEILSEFNPTDLEAIEIYRGPSELPPQFTEDNCAAIVLWSRTPSPS